MRKTMSLSIVALMAVAGSVLAGPAENFAKYDANEDGLLQKEEYAAMRTAWGKDAAETEKFFAKKDKDGNGALSKEEFGLK